MSRLTQARTRSLLDALPYWDLRGGTMFLADGRMEVGVEVQFPPALFLTGGGLELVLRQLKGVLRNAVPQGQRLRLTVEVGPVGAAGIAPYRAETTSPVPLARLLGEKRAEFYEGLAELPGEVLRWRAYLSVTVGEKRLGTRPNLLSYALGSAVPLLRRKTHIGYTAPEFEERLLEAGAVRQRLLHFLASAGLEARAMTDEDVFSLCFRFLNPALKHLPVPGYRPTWQVLPAEVLERFGGLAPPTLRAQLAKSELDNSRPHELGLGWRRARMLGLVHSPDETAYGMINHLLDASGELYLVVDLQHDPYNKAMQRLKSSARKFYSASVDTNVYVDPNVRTGLAEAEAAIEHITAAGDHVYQVGVSLVVLGADSKDLESRITRAFGASASVPGSPFLILQHGLLAPFTQCLPFGGELIDQRLSLLETNAAHFFPLGAPWAGHRRPTAMFHNRWKALTFLDPFDPGMTNWNALIVGGSGQGKTFFAQYMITELLRQDDVDVIIVDRGRSYEKTVELLGGAMIDVEPGGQTAINPFDLAPGETAPDEDKIAFLAGVVRAMVGGVVPRLEAEEDALIGTALRAAYLRKTDEVFEGGEFRPRLGEVRLSDFVRTLSNLERVGDKTVTAEDRHLADTLARTLQNWTGKTPYGSFVDRTTSVPLSGARLVCYDTSRFQLDSPLATVGIMLIADLVWRRVRGDRTRRKVVIFDECWALLTIPAAAHFVVELYRRFRRYNAAVWSVSQSMADFQRPEAHGILQNTTYHYLLRTPGEEEAVRDLLHLPQAAMEAFLDLKRVDGVYSEVLAWVRTETGSLGDVIWVRPTPLDLWTFTTSAQAMARRDEAIARAGGDLRAALTALAYGQT
ncbi:ATP-binding protein [Deinococcus planocerae]|uniref:TraG/VirB4 family ATPase n=1 Tax=Deinococcus planocerae TaxID=1737569 RepID=UPI000C7F27A3|nr:ATP-binding protein [Deinococcus planocerae]